MTTGATIRELAACVSASDGRDPVDILTRQAANREPDLVPVRNARMAATPFTFYRGAAAVMAADLAATPDSGVITQLCGDAHLSNLGLYLSPERRMIFDLNDFDETHPGPFEWDVKRLAASFVVAGRANGFPDKQLRGLAAEAARAYRRSIRRAVEKTTLGCWYATIDADLVLPQISSRLDTSTERRTQRALKKARHRNSEQALEKLCDFDADGTPHIRSEPPLLVPIEELYPDDPGGVEARIAHRFETYRAMLDDNIRHLVDQFTFRQVARKVVGVGSVGTRCWIALMEGRGPGDVLFLQIKEATDSVIAPYVSSPSFPNAGQRVVAGQRLMQASSDIFLGWTSGLDEFDNNRDFYVRQLRDGKGSVVIEALDPEEMKLYARLCGVVLAQAHARTRSRHAIAEYLSTAGTFSAAIADFAMAYESVNQADHTAFVGAIAAGTLPSNDLESSVTVADLPAAR